MGCSSARLQSLGDFEVFGMPFAYLTCGAATILGCLWDVTDRDIDSLTFFFYLNNLKQVHHSVKHYDMDVIFVN